MISAEEQKRLDEELLRECRGYTTTDNKPDGAYIEVNGLFFNINKIKRLIEAGADVNAKDDDGWSPLYYAIKKNTIVIVEYLISAGANVNAKKDGESLLHFAVRNYGKQRIKLLISAGANVNAKDNLGRTPMHVAVTRPGGIIKILHILIKAGSDVNAQDNYGYTPLHEINDYKKLGTVELLIFAGADVNAENLDGETPLLLLYDYVEIRNLLKEHGAVIIKK